MIEGVITMLVNVPRWTEAEMVAVAKSDHLSTHREFDLAAVHGPTDVSLDVTASSAFEARERVRQVLGDLPLDAFLASTA